MSTHTEQLSRIAAFLEAAADASIVGNTQPLMLDLVTASLTTARSASSASIETEETFANLVSFLDAALYAFMEKHTWQMGLELISRSLDIATRAAKA